MDHLEISRVAAENSARRELLRFMLQALRTVSSAGGSPIARDLAREGLRNRLRDLQGELLSPLGPDQAHKALVDAGNSAVRAVVAEFVPQFEAALGDG